MNLSQELIEKIAQSSSKGHKQDIIETKYGDGYAQRTLNGLSAKKATWSLTFLLKNDVELNDLFFVGFFDEVGYYDTFVWDSFGDMPAETRWIIDKDSLNIVQPGGTAFDVSITITQDYSL